MVKPVYGVMVIWWNFPMVNHFLGHISIDGKMAKWWRKSIIKWIIWLDLTIAWVISYVSVSLIFYQHSNDEYPNDYGEAHLCYLWCLLFYLPLCRVTSPFSPMMKWCNGEMIPDGAVMVVRLFRRGDSILALEWLLSLEWISPRDNCPGGKLSLEWISSSRDKILWDMSRGTVPEVFVPRDNTWQHLTHYWDGNCPGRCLGIS